jgi:hypothetical protein
MAPPFVPSGRFSSADARQLISDGHPGAAISSLHNEIAVVKFILHGLAAGIHKVIPASNGLAKFRRGNHNLLRTLLGRVLQLRN